MPSNKLPAAYRTPNVPFFAWLLSVGPIVIVVVGLQEIPRDWAYSAMAIGCGAVILSYTLGRFRRLSIVVSNAGIIVVSWFKNFNYDWSEIRHFDLGDQLNDLTLPQQLSGSNLQAYVTLRNGRHISIPGLGFTRINRKIGQEQVQAILDVLNLQLRQTTSGTPT
jgi:hypothetical protein